MIVEIKNIKKNFGEKEVLKDITLKAESGKAIGLLGRNGAGKTTTIRIIMGVFYPDSGDVLVDGEKINRKKIKIGYLPEERGLYPKQKIGEQLSYFGRLRGQTKQQSLDAVKKWLDRMGLTEYKDRKLETLSKGNQQKIQLAATLLCDPELIILDEPFSGLDPVNAMLLKDVISESIHDGAAVIFSSHQMNYVEEFCSDIYILNSGKIAVSGNLGEIKRAYPRDTINIYSRDPESISTAVLRKAADIVSSALPDGESSCVTVKLRDEKDKDRIMSMLLEEKAPFDGFMVKEQTLNEIFVQYTGDGI